MALSIFYTPDGHRRFAEEEGISIAASYRTGIHTLIEEIIEPTISCFDVERLDIFCLSSRNLRNRNSGELKEWLSVGLEMLNGVVERCAKFANVKSVGNFLAENIDVVNSPGSPTVRFFIGNSIEDTDDIAPVDLFIRSGGQLRLSGAPRALLGDDTELYSIPTLHPRIEFAEIRRVVDAYRARYVRHTDENPRHGLRNPGAAGPM